LGAILAIALGLIKFDGAITFIDFNKLGDFYYHSKRK
jgi:hypothetical protein